MKVAYFDCFSGASGDMLLGCLLDAGLSLDELRTDLDRLGIGGYTLEAQRVTRHGLSGTHLRVRLSSEDRPARTLPNIERILRESDLPESVQARSLRVFTRLARAEARVHGTTVDQIHFHELGAVDSLVDIVGFVCALDRLGIEAVHSSPLTLGGGTVQTEHGRLPAPAPATRWRNAARHPLRSRRLRCRPGARRRRPVLLRTGVPVRVRLDGAGRGP